MAASEDAILRPDSENALRSHVSNDQRRHVGVVGAGVSGLCYADILLSHGSEVTILEVRVRMGGRICQSDHPGYIVNMSVQPTAIHISTSLTSKLIAAQKLVKLRTDRTAAAVSPAMSSCMITSGKESETQLRADLEAKPEVRLYGGMPRRRQGVSIPFEAKAALFTNPVDRRDLRPSYAEDTNPAQWPQEVWNLASFAAPNNHPTLLFYLYGDCSRYIVNSVYGKTREEKQRFLQAFLYPYYSCLPGFNAGKEACHPEAILATEWLKDDFSGNGSYCNFQVGVEEADKDALAFRHGCPERRLWFFREHAAPFEECGTVAGAYLSGESATQMIVAMYNDSLGKRKPEAITTSVEHDQ
ncbi:hypothetical protein NPX13_g627 [Xylaria arbuscula]|uniref:Amine oxidase domain-containing protein n=1 Tax=Xylaria arbuscula TaxID=114810 RepID=A0A9W8NNJ4_9PEZI|nr:hypothetical protein NPX13_g627 [Xylaria arbuscula]